MRFIAKTGKTFVYKSESGSVTKTLQFSPNDPDLFEDLDLLDIIWDVAGNLVQEVAFESVYINPETQRHTRAYTITFLTGKNILYGKTAVSTLLRQIERAVADRLDVAMRFHTAKKIAVQPNITQGVRTKLTPVDAIGKAVAAPQKLLGPQINC